MLKFDPVLARLSIFPEGTAAPEGMEPGPCAMGPTMGDTPSSMHVWVFQHTPSGLALASGDTRNEPQFTTDPEPRWRVRTVRDPASKEFVLNEPAVAMAIALVSRGNTTDVHQWSQAVKIVKDSPLRGNPN
jgi:hypothetical protein